MITKFKLLVKRIMKVLAISSIFSLLLFGCDLENLFQDDEDEYFVTLADARMVAGNLLFAAIEPKDTASIFLQLSDYTVQKNVANITPIQGEERDPLFYIVNYTAGGFVILSADKRLEPVLAYSRNNSFLMDQETFPPGLVDWLEEYANLVRELRRLQSRPAEIVTVMWEAIYLAPHNIDMIFVMMCPDEHYVEKKLLLQTQWSQGCGYNKLLEDSCTVRCNRPPVGCVATAVAQILKYHADNGWNGSYTLANGNNAPQLNWSTMPLTGINENNHGHIPNIMAHLGPMLKMDYACDGSGSGINSAHTTFTTNFPFTTAVIRDINNASDYSIVINEIRNNRPVYMRGRESKTEETLKGDLKTTYSGHAWVADGYSQLWNCEQGFTNQYMIHMNWGWGSSHDGFFLKKEGRFDEDRKIIHNIRRQ